MRFIILLALVACATSDSGDDDPRDTDSEDTDTDTDTDVDTDPGDTTPPDTTVDSGPDASTTDDAATFTFSCDEAPCTFECSLDGATAESCTSPHTVSGLDVGAHELSVVATDGAGNTDASAATWRWAITIANPWVDVAVGRQHSCGIRDSGALYCWGSNFYGATGHASSQSTPLQVGTATNWTDVSSGDWHTCMVNDTGALYCMGYNAGGRLGDASETNRAEPTRVGSGLDWASVTLGNDHSCAQKADTSIHCWGDNGQNQLGLPTRPEAYDTPAAVLDATSTTSWDSLDAGKYHTCARRGDGAMYCWGQAMFGQVGINDFSGGPGPNQTSPGRVGSDSDWDQVVTGGRHSCATRATGDLWCWGDRAHGQVGSGSDVGIQFLPGQVGSATDWMTQAAGEHHGCAINVDGELYCWGRDEFGQLGDGSDTLVDDVTSPVMVGDLTSWARVSAHYHQTCAIDVAGNLYCWGINEHSSLGLGHTDRVHGPTLVAAP